MYNMRITKFINYGHKVENMLHDSILARVADPRRFVYSHVIL
jgi:hypothetical protein